jgi:AcrR family transcriptional regulator
VTFQRARSEEQRELRRRDILDTATAMLDEMPAAELSLNELSRRVGLAKSNVLRYFESREVVLLELLEHEVRALVADTTAELAKVSGTKRPLAERSDLLAATLTAALVRRPMLCDLLASQPGVLEHNASVDVVLRFKRSSRDSLMEVAEAARKLVPELGAAAEQFCMMAVVLAGSLWAHTQCSASVLEAYAIDPELAAMRLDLPEALEETLATLIAGTLARARRKG